jgi:hypothetical protein
MGPPTTLNLRNISWHGFFHPEEVHPQYAMLLLTVIVSIGSLVEGMQYASQLSHRPQVQFSQLSVLKHVPYSEVEMCTELLSGTSFVIQSKKLIWEEAFHLWKEQNYGLFTVVILPEVEHGLRRIFAHVNNCPHRVLTAEVSYCISLHSYATSVWELCCCLAYHLFCSLQHCLQHLMRF